MKLALAKTWKFVSEQDMYVIPAFSIILVVAAMIAFSDDRVEPAELVGLPECVRSTLLATATASTPMVLRKSDVCRAQAYCSPVGVQQRKALESGALNAVEIAP